jgi:putative membrane-bound dehydrogenase-like protein
MRSLNPNRRLPGFSAILSLAFTITALAEPALPNKERLQTSPVLRHLKPNPTSGPARTPAEQTVAQMYVPEGFRVDLVAAEPDLHQPVAFAWDERGRIWVIEAYSYPTKRAAGQGLDKIVIFEDKDGDGKFETRKIFAEGLNLASALEVGYGGVWVGAAPELLFIPDRNHDDIPDGPPQVLLNGFGFQDTHECLNSFLWGPDGWLYGNQGVFNYARIGKPGASEAERTELRAGVWRYHPVRHEFEVFAHGGSNPWGLDYDEHGQLFMTHCRSYWGRGLTTHVIQGGHYWNQANANYAPFIIANPPAEFPEFRNFMLASARYDHGAGGAGQPGSDAIYGGHSHVGTMIYQGDNWPDEYRGHLFTHNLGGHQMNQQINKRLGSGFDTVHAGKDQSFCTDPRYVPVDLQYGPDGAVYSIDWYDQQHCHNPNTERWDRSNGRIYRMSWAATYKPAKVDLSAKTDLELVDLLKHKNAWYGRTAQRLLTERSTSGLSDSKSKGIDSEAQKKLLRVAQSAPAPTQRLNALWAAHAVGLWNEDMSSRALRDNDEYVRAWAVQFWTDNPRQVPPSSVLKTFSRLAQEDPSPVVRLYLASAAQRVANQSFTRDLLYSLANHKEDRDDRNLPLLLWDAIAQQMPRAEGTYLKLAERTALPQLADYIYWYAATLPKGSLNEVISALSKASGDTLRRRLAGLWLALEPRGSVPMPDMWKTIAPRLYANDDVRIRRQAERIAAVFGDTSVFPRLREALASRTADLQSRKHAFAVLSLAQDRPALPAFLRLLDDKDFRSQTITLLPRFDDPQIPEALIAKFDQWPKPDQALALNALTSRASFALALLDAVAAGRVKRDQLSAFYVRQLTGFKNADVDKRVIADWGRINQSPAEKQSKMDKLEKTFNEAPLWAYESSAGQEHFQKLCSSCHRIGNEGNRLGPELTGAGKHGIRYFLENIIDPDAVIGTDFQMTTIETKSGDSFSGLIVNDSAAAMTLRTVAGESIIPKTDIAKKETSSKSLMPEGLLESLTDRQQLELLKFLTTH